MQNSLKFFFALILFTQNLFSNFELAAFVIDGVEKEEAIVFEEKNNNIYLEKDILFQIPDIKINEEKDEVITPIGTVSYSDIFKNSKDKNYFTLSQLNKVLRTEGAYSKKEVSLFLKTPWRHLRNKKLKSSKVPDIYPQGNVINGIRLDVDSRYQSGIINHRGELELTGRLFDGITRVSGVKEGDNNPYINELFWLKNEKRYNILVGLQNTQPHQLLPYQQMTGIQGIWTNYDLPEGSGRAEATLKPSLGSDNRIVKGKGPIGGSVVLVVNNQIRAVERIRLDGTYQVDISKENLTNAPLIELWVYERDPVGAPIEKHNLNYIKTASLLQKGQFSVLGGVGLAGNELHFDRPETNSSNVANIYARYGLTKNITVEGGVMQDDKDKQYGILGITTALGDNLTLHTAVSLEDDLMATYATLEGQWGSDHLSMRWQEQPENYRGIDSATKDGYMDYLKQINDTLSIGLNGRYNIEDDEEIRFLLPTIRYLPFKSLSLSLIPNYSGYYRFTSTYTPDTSTRLNYVYEEDEHRVSFVQDITDEWRYYLDGTTDLKDKNRYEAGVSWQEDNKFFETGLIYSNDEFGFKANMRHNVLPGLYAKYEARYEPYIQEENKKYFYINLIADFGILKGKFHPSKNPEIERTLRGYIAGNVYDEETKENIDTDDINILLNNSSRKAGNANGKFFIENLKAGIYTVQLDASSLPMEYTPIKSKYNVKIADGAVSKVDFYVKKVFGISGQLHRKKREEPVKIILVSQKDDKEFVSYTDRFDYYRFDGLERGVYKLYVEDKNVKPRKVIVKDDFLFEQDLFEK